MGWRREVAESLLEELRDGDPAELADEALLDEYEKSTVALELLRSEGERLRAKREGLSE